MQFHEVANIFPLMEGKDFESLKADIDKNGLLEPIWVYENKIIDGRNRYRACSELDIKPTTREWDGKGQLINFVISLNLHRRHLTESQRAMVAANVANMPQHRPENKAANLRTSQSEAASLLNVSERSVNTAKKVYNQGVSDLLQAVQTGKVSVSAAADISELPKEDQQTIVEQGKDQILKAAQKIRAVRSLANRDKRQAEKLEAMKIKPPEGKYRTIVIDPPWEMEKILRDQAPMQTGFDYPTMSIDELQEFYIPAHDECHLYCWTTQKFLPKAFEILEAWGFKYIFTMTWHKPGGFQPFNLPQYNSEFVLFGRRGGQDFMDTKQFFTCFNAPRKEHSRKPDEFYDLVKRVSPEPRIDIFSREKREGFDQYGNETEKFQGEK